jgi:hypothetical protein
MNTSPTTWDKGKWKEMAEEELKTGTSFNSGEDFP